MWRDTDGGVRGTGCGQSGHEGNEGISQAKEASSAKAWRPGAHGTLSEAAGVAEVQR
jgi:hypothetical protein